MRVANVAGADDGDLDRAGDSADRVPLRLTVVELRGIAPVDRHRLGASRLHPPRELRGELAPVVAAASDLHRHGYPIGGKSLNAGGHEGLGELRGLHERGALALLCDLGHGARHVDVDEHKPCAKSPGHALRRLAEELGLGAEELHREVRLALGALGELPAAVAAVVEPGARDHLRIGDVRPAGAGHHAVCGVGHPRHRSHEQRISRKALSQGLVLVAARERGDVAAQTDARAKAGQDVGGARLYLGQALPHYSSSTLRTARNASWGTSTLPICFMRFLPSFCFSRSLRLREMSPP